MFNFGNLKRSTSSLPPSSPVASSYSSRASPFESEPESPSAGALLPATPEPQERKKRVRVKRAQRTIARLAKRFREDEEGIFGQSFNEDGKEEGGKQVDELAGDPVSAG